MIRAGIHLAESEDEKEAVYRFRYDVYVEEMGRYGAAADHANRRLVEAEDATARIFYAAEDGAVVATSRFSWGGDAPFSQRPIEHYQLAPSRGSSGARGPGPRAAREGATASSTR